MDDENGGPIRAAIELFQVLGPWGIPYVLIGVVVLVTIQRGEHRRGVPAVEPEWLMAAGGAVIIVIVWPLLMLMFAWLRWKEWRRYR
jgi:hypothetical protein